MRGGGRKGWNVRRVDVACIFESVKDCSPALLDVAALAEGTYLVAVRTQSEMLVERVVVIR